MIILHIPLILS